MSFFDFQYEDFRQEDTALQSAMRSAVQTLPAVDTSRRLDLKSFAKEAWNVVEPGVDFIDNWHIGAICDHLEAVTSGEIERLLINIPPRHMKSLLVGVFWQPWVWTFDPESRWIFGSYHISLSTRDNTKARRIIESPWYQQHWGRVYALAPDQNQKQKFENTRTGHRIATSVDAAATGEGGKYIVFDDPLKAKDSRSPAKRENANVWWQETMSTRVNPGEVPRFVGVMQRLHEEDTSGILLEQGDYVHLCLPEEYEPKLRLLVPAGAPNPLGFEDPRKEKGELLWPRMFNREKVDSLRKTLGSYGFAAQEQQIPAPEEGAIFKTQWIRHYDTPARYDLATRSVYIGEKKLSRILLSVDANFKESDTSDYVVIQVWGVHKSDYFLVDQYRGRIGFNKTVTAVTNMLRKWPNASEKLIEAKANGEAIIETLKLNGVPGIVGVSPKESKEARAAAVSVYFESGNVHIPSPDWCPWIGEYIHELRMFPKGANDDQVDGTTQALSRYTSSVDMASSYRAMLGRA